MFSLYKNLYSKRASGEISAEQLVNVIRNGVYKEQVEYFRYLKSVGKKDEAAAAKRDMAAVTFSGVCNEGRSFELTTVQSEVSMFDLDNLQKEQIKSIREVLQVCPWVVMVFVTVSGCGLRVVVRTGKVKKEEYAGVYVAVCNSLRKLTGAEPDMQCKDFARLSVMSYDPDIYYNPEAGLFPYVEEAKKQMQVQHQQHMQQKDSMQQTDRPKGSFTPYSQSRYSASPDTERILDKFFSRYPYVEGRRHSTLLFLGRYLRFCKVESWQMGSVTDRVCGFATGNGMSEREVKDAVMWGYEHGNEPPQLPHLSYLHYKGVKNNTKKRGVSGTSDIEEEDIVSRLCSNIPDRVFDVIPDSLKNLLVIARDKTERDMLFLSAVGMMSGIFAYLRTLYGNRMYSPHLYTVEIAPPGSGKGLAAIAMKLGRKIEKKLAQRYAIEWSVYEKKLLKWELELKLAAKEKRVPDIELRPVPPKRQVLVVQPNSSKSQFMITLRDSGDAGVIVATCEIDSLNSSLATDYGKHLPELRMAFHHETIGQNYKVDKEPVVIDTPRVALVIAGTIEQYMNFVTNVVDGMSSRFCPYVSMRRYGWKSQSPLKDNGAVDAEQLIDELSEKLCTFFFDNEGEEIMIHFTREQWDRLDARFSELLNIVMVECVDGSEAIVVRGGIIAVRIAMVFCGIRLMEAGWKTKSYTCSDEDFDAALDVAINGVKHSIHLTTLYKNMNERRKMNSFFQKLAVLDAMGEIFSYSEFVNGGRESGFSESSMNRALKKYLSAGIVERRDGKYRVLKRMNKDIYDSPDSDDNAFSEPYI